MLKPGTYRLEAVIGELFADAERQPEFFASWQDRVNSALGELQHQLINHYINKSGEGSLRRYFRYHRSVLARLSDRLLDHQKGRHLEDDHLNRSLGAVLERIERLIDENRQLHLYPAEDPDQVTHYKNRKESIAMIKAISAFNSDRSDLTTLLNAFQNAFIDLTDHDQTAPSYLEIAARWRYITVVQEYLRSPKAQASELFWQLYRENFNAAQLMVWYQKDLIQQLSDAPENAVKQRLSGEMKRSLVIGIPPKQAFDPRRENITAQLPVWLRQLSEVHGLRSSDKVANYRLPLELSVAQFGHFLRLCAVTGCFHEQNISEMLRFFVHHFTSKKQAHISQKSLAKAFYGAEQSTAASMRAWLQRMIDHINKKYFPK